MTEAIRHAIAPSEAYPDVRTVFKGGTSLAKAYPFLNRFSEDVDVNIIPPPGREFGHSRRKKARKELHTRLDEGIPLDIDHKREGTNFATSAITYASATPGSGAVLGMTFGSVLVEMSIREQPPGMCGMRSVTSLAGEAASELDPALLEEYPHLKPFEVLTADPAIAVVDKLDALNWRSESDNPEQIATRARDIYDLARLLSHVEVRAELNASLVSEMHEIVVKSIPPGLAGRATPRPEDGFAAAKAFQSGHPSNEALRGAYPRIRNLVYSDEDWIEFEDAIAIIHSSAHRI
ncbi:nucleotidyl transferase AbiEii/AbiGii toxin family protein [Candidatus Poriferisocius sp.]|uniref:nucleotidyl transferase AbiEii/AbiGii toxin family protein n=1 Tax=Candidatus Poriferisocius sp. TaxID=3101276 RepID=UPI003B02D6D5